MFNADKLTIDAQSALRRCIELCSHTTRFFIVVTNYDKLLKPIVSRFCNIYISFPIINNKITNLHSINKIDNNDNNVYLEQQLINTKTNTLLKCLNISIKLYNKGYSAIDILNFIKKKKFNIKEVEKYKLLIYFDNIRFEYRNDKLLIFFLIYTFFLRNVFIFEI